MSKIYSTTIVLLLLAAFAPAPTAARHAGTAAGHHSGTAAGRHSWTKNLKLVGSAFVVAGETAVSLTSNSTDGLRAGRALSIKPVRLLLAQADERSFHTRFRFRIIPSPSYGDGLAFIITTTPTFLGASDGYLGLFHKSGKVADVSTVAVELDTHRDVALRDRDDNHVALDAGSIFSVASASPGVDLKAGLPITGWIQYRSQRRRLRAWFSYSSRRPRTPALSVIVDLSRHLQGDWYVGFSASNGKGTALHIIESWSFRTFRTHTSSQGSASSTTVPTVTPPPALPVPRADQSRHLLVFGVVCAVLSVASIHLLCAMCARTRRLKRKKSLELSTVLPKSVLRSC